MRQAARAYFETQVTTTSKGQLLIMLYDGAIKILTQAKERMQAKDYAEKGKLISNAIDIINELASSLNAEKGGDLAANLSELYFYCNKRLFMANSRLDQGMIDEVIKILGGLRSAYAQILDTPEAQAALANAAATAPAEKGPRTPIAVGNGAAAGAPVPTSRAHNAYAFMGAARNAAPTPEPAGESVGENVMENAPPREAIRETPPEGEIPVAGPARPEASPASPIGALLESEGSPEMPVPGGMPPINAARKAAASSLYRKFTS